jgi:putative membrane protein
MSSRTLAGFVALTIKGFCMAAANVIPGVSGGTMAILIGLMLGSLRRIWPWKETLPSLSDNYGREVAALQINILPASFNGEVIGAQLLMCLGVLVILDMNMVTRNKG